MLGVSLVGLSRRSSRAWKSPFALLPNHIGSVDTDAFKIAARSAESSLTENVASPFQADQDKRRSNAGKTEHSGRKARRSHATSGRGSNSCTWRRRGEANQNVDCQRSRRICQHLLLLYDPSNAPCRSPRLQRDMRGCKARGSCPLGVDRTSHLRTRG